jgi:hypothetical protein
MNTSSSALGAFLIFVGFAVVIVNYLRKGNMPSLWERGRIEQQKQSNPRASKKWPVLLGVVVLILAGLWISVSDKSYKTVQSTPKTVEDLVGSPNVESTPKADRVEQPNIVTSTSIGTGYPPSLLACRSIELYDRFSGEFFANGLLLPKLSKEFQDNFSFRDGTGKSCKIIVDDDPARLEYLRNLYHVENTAPGYSCIRGAKDTECWWTATDKLRYIGHGLQLTDEQFARVQAMLAEVDALDKKADDYFERSNDIGFDQTGHIRKNLSERERREMYELQDLGTETSHKARQLETRARSLGHLPT